MHVTRHFRTLVPNLADAVARFPGPVIASLVMATAANLMIAEKNFAEDLLWSAVAGFIASGCGHLFAEAGRWRRQKGATVAILAGIVAAVGYWFHTELGLHRIFFTVGLLLLLFSAGFLRAAASQAAFWLFDFRLVVAALLSAIVTGIACGGITAILASLEFLFEVKVPRALHLHLWATGVTVVGPIYGLAITPKSLEEEIDVRDYRSSMLERGASVLINWVLVPLTLVYAVVLYSYAIKISVSWALPKGQIGTLVMLFALAGTATYMVSYPWRDRGTPLLRWFRSWWFILTIVPVALLIVGTWRRIADYGITPQRYALIILALWLSALAVTFALRRGRMDIRQIMASLAILILAASVGPWGARMISAKDQYARLESILVQYGLLKDGRLAERPPPAQAIPPGDRQTAASIVNFLVNEREHERLRPWLAGTSALAAQGAKAEPRRLADPLIQILGYSSLERLPFDLRRVEFKASVPATFVIPASSEVRGPIELRGDYQAQAARGDAFSLRVETKGSTIAIVRGTDIWAVETNELLTKAAERSGSEGGQLPFEVVSDQPRGRMRLIVERITGDLSKEEAKISLAVIWLILPQQPGPAQTPPIP